jgi:hypothetical protein
MSSTSMPPPSVKPPTSGLKQKKSGLVYKSTGATTSVLPKPNSNPVPLTMTSTHQAVPARAPDLDLTFNNSATTTSIKTKRPIEETKETSETSDNNTITKKRKTCEKTCEKTDDELKWLYSNENPYYTHIVSSQSELVKSIKNTNFLEELIKFSKEYHYTKLLTKTSPDFLTLVKNFRMAYYEDTKTNDELWTEFTDFSSYVEYKKN